MGAPAISFDGVGVPCGWPCEQALRSMDGLSAGTSVCSQPVRTLFEEVCCEPGRSATLVSHPGRP
eukprot:3767460-Alexandrium_andersonii.AAC.1